MAKIGSNTGDWRVEMIQDNDSFSQLPAVKKDTIFGAAKKNFGPSYFVTALVGVYVLRLADPSVQISDFCLYF